jgi:hypothetical protein
MIIINTDFTQYELTEQEQLAGYRLGPEQKAVIQNDIAEAAIHKSGLKFDPSNPSDYIQKEAELAGRIAFLRYMLARSAQVEDTLNHSAHINLFNPQ